MQFSSESTFDQINLFVQTGSYLYQLFFMIWSYWLSIHSRRVVNHSLLT